MSIFLESKQAMMCDIKPNGMVIQPWLSQPGLVNDTASIFH